MEEYQAGKCNIDIKERRKRKVAGIVGFSNALILTAVLFWLGPGFNLLVVPIFLLFWFGFLGFIQYRKGFCAGLGLRGKMHFDDEESVADPKQVRKHREKVLKMIFSTGLQSLLVTTTCYILLNL